MTERHPTRFCTPSHPCTILVVDDDDSEIVLLRREADMAYDLGMQTWLRIGLTH